MTGGGRHLYKVSEYGGWYYAACVHVGLLTNTEHSVGKAHSLSDALELIRLHSGRQILSID